MQNSVKDKIIKILIVIVIVALLFLAAGFVMILREKNNRLEPSEEAEDLPQIVEVEAVPANLSGKWTIDTDATDPAKVAAMFGDDYEKLGAAIEFTGTDGIQYSIGSFGGQGSFVREGNSIIADVKDSRDGSALKLNLPIIADGGEARIVMTVDDYDIRWKPFDDSHVYDAILNSYYEAISAQKPVEELMDTDISYLIGYCYSNGNGLDNIGYCLYDIDGDGCDELFIGAILEDLVMDNEVFDMYTVSGTAAKQVFSSTERDYFYICSGNFILEKASSSAFESWESVYRFDGGKLSLIESIIYDIQRGEDNPWYVEKPGADRTPVTAEEAAAETSIYESSITKLNFTPFSAYIKDAE